jgi:hypothetical protein
MPENVTNLTVPGQPGATNPNNAPAATVAPAVNGGPTLQPTPEEIDAQKRAEFDEELQVSKKPWYRKRFDKLTAQREAESRKATEAVQRAARLEALLARHLERGQTATQAPGTRSAPEAPTRPRPTMESCDFDQDRYIEEVADWKIEQREHKTKVTTERTTQQQQAERVQQDFEGRRLKMVGSGREKYPDFEDVAFSVPVSDVLGAIVLSSENPADIAYHLGKNREVFEQINRLDPISQAIAVGRLQAQISSTPPRTAVNPPPIKTVGGKAVHTNSSADLAKNDLKAWIEKRRKGEIK